ncbi:YbhB/YbcL family Raf kinase inhibitor-like protein [Sphaerisporangium sp. NBC_01403]|uniref:YbhB/YbcL family Raf kinase inhibitor-like protein n=1 Tax=Sphaerisporangium sp. NBC_01403 TaxID=2903599 RepID=UPI00324E9683
MKIANLGVARGGPGVVRGRFRVVRGGPGVVCGGPGVVRRRLGMACVGLLLAALTGCSAEGASPSAGGASPSAGGASDSSQGASPSAGLKVSSPAFAEGAAIPKKYACARQGGQDISPPLAWTGVPESARELAIVVDDTDAPGGSYIHWIVTGILVSESGSGEGATPGKVAPGSDGSPAYAGPCPPGGVHHYHFIVYALRGPIKSGGDARAVHKRIEDAAVTSGETTGTWGS